MNLLAIELILIAVLYALFSVLAQRKLSNVDKLYELRARMNHKTKRLMELTKSDAKSPELAIAQKELMELSTQSMKLQMKPMLVILPVLLLVYYVFLPTQLPANATISIASFTLSYNLFFILFVFVVGIILSLGFSAYDRRRLKDKYSFGLLQPKFRDEEQAAQA